MQRGQLLEDEQGCSAAAAAAGRVRRRAEGGRRQRRRRATYLSRPVERTPRLTSLAAVLDGPASGMTAIASDVGRGEGCLPGLAGAGRQQEVGQPACQPARVRPPARPPAAAAALAGKRASAGAGWLSRPCSPIHQTLCHTPPPLLLLSLRLSQSWPPSETFVHLMRRERPSRLQRLTPCPIRPPPPPAAVLDRACSSFRRPSLPAALPSSLPFLNFAGHLGAPDAYTDPLPGDCQAQLGLRHLDLCGRLCLLDWLRPGDERVLRPLEQGRESS